MSTLKLKQSSDHFRCEILNQHHSKAATDIFTNAFCNYEPMTKYLGIQPEDFSLFAHQVVQKAVEEELSVVMLDGNKVIALAIVEDIVNSTNAEIKDTKLHYIFSFLENLVGPFFKDKSFKKNHLSHLFVTAVEPTYQGKGLSGRINLEAMKIARESGFDFMCSEFTSIFNERGTVKHIPYDCNLINSCQYKEFTYQGKKPFPHLDGGANAYIWQLKPHAVLDNLKASNT